MAPVAIVFAVLAHGTASDVGYVLAAETTPLVVFLLVGGVIADRMNRRKLMLRADALRAAAQGVLGIWILFGRPPLWAFMVLSVLLGIGHAFFNPAFTGMIPQLLGSERLQQGNALSGIASSSGRIVGPAIAGLIVATSNPGWAVLIDGFTYLVSVLSLTLVHIDWTSSESSESFLPLLRQGWSEFWSRTWLWAVVLEFSMVNALFGSFLVLGPVIAKESLGGARAWGLIMAGEGVGAVLGGVLMLRMHPRRPLLIATLATLAFPLPLFFIALRAPALVVSVVALLAGLFVTVFSVLWSTTVQREIPLELLSRVSAYDWFGSLVLLPISMAVMGPLSAVIGVTTTLVGSAVLMMLLTLVVLLFPSVVQLRATGSRSITSSP